MGGIYRQSFDDTSNSQETELLGGTNQTKIGNVGDRLKVDSSFSTPPKVIPAYTGSTVRFNDMNVANGGVARDTSISSTTVYTTVYSYSGSGHLFAFVISLEGNLVGADPFNIKLVIDGVTCFEVDTMDIGTTTYWDLSSAGDEATMGLSLQNNSVRFSQKNGSLTYSTGLSIAIKKSAGGAKRFRGGMVYLTKDT